MAVKRTISFTDIDGNPKEEEYIFALDLDDAVEMKLVAEKGSEMEGYLTRIFKEVNVPEIVKTMKDMLFASVGRREGNLLVKDEQVKREFRYGGAYKQLFAELMEEMDSGAAEFFINIMPDQVQKQMKAELDKVYTKEELLAMTDEEFDKIAGTDTKKMSVEHFQIAFERRASHKNEAA
jgi:hypothetical protein